jgi:predicted transcriptional regulator
LIKARHRSKLQIIADMLYVAGRGSKKTHIMYGANLSYSLVMQYLNKLLKSCLIRQVNDEYLITEKGRKFLRKYQEYSEHHKELKGQIVEINNKKNVLEKMCSSSS